MIKSIKKITRQVLIALLIAKIEGKKTSNQISF